MNDIIWFSKVDEILNRGIFLEEIGVKNWALTRDKALKALERLKALQVPILGGDVYELLGNVIQSNCDNWYCDKLEDEMRQEYLERSIQKAKEYIENYKNDKPEQIFFSFVPDVSIFR